MRHYQILILLLFLPAMASFGPDAFCEEISKEEVISINSEYEALLKALARPSVWSDSRQAAQNLAKTEIETLSKRGLKVLPFLMGKFQDESTSSCARTAIIEIASRVTKRNLYKVDMQKWWQSGGKETPQQFAVLYASWQKAVKELTDAGKPLILKTSEEILNVENGRIATTEKETDLGKIYRQIRELGIEILPILLEVAQKGDYTLLPMVTELSDNAVRARGAVAPKTTTEKMTRDFARWWERTKRNIPSRFLPRTLKTKRGVTLPTLPAKSLKTRQTNPLPRSRRNKFRHGRFGHSWTLDFGYWTARAACGFRKRVL